MRIPLLVVALALVLAGCAEAPPEAPTPTGSTPDAATSPVVSTPATTPPVTTTVTPTIPGAREGVACGAPLPDLDTSFEPQKPRVRLNTNLGPIIVELETERAPVTAGNFLALAESGFYDGTLFHRVVRGFVIQGGDPLSKDDDPSNDGSGGAETIPDEFHPQLRHDAAGVLSMANSGPNSGSSQFFITLTATPHLDDRHAVFGRVVEGIEVVQAIGETQTGANDRPVEPIRVESAEVLEPTTYEAQHGADVHVVVPSKKAEAGRPVTFSVILKNTGNVRDVLALSVQHPEGWACQSDAPVVVLPGSGRVVFLTLTPPAGFSSTATIEVGVRMASDPSRQGGTDTAEIVPAELGAQVKDGDQVTANYVGLLPDGRLFDTSMERVANDPEQPKFDTINGFRARPSYSSFPFTVGSGVIEGFTKLARTAKVGETVTGPIPAAEAYATGDMYQRPLTGRDLVFELEIVRVG